jgi:hypothetical protein
MSWSAFLFKTTTGNIGPRIDINSASWDIPLNDIESLSIEIQKSSIPKIDKDYWLAPWWAGVILFWNEVPIFAGPIISKPTEVFSGLRIDCGGIRALLAERLVVREQTDWSKLAEDTVPFYGMSLGTVARRVVQLVMQKPGGYLPIEFPVPEQLRTDDADHQRVYESFNVANLDCNNVLTKLSNASRGPDIMFKPRLVGDSRFVWDMWTGTEENPRIKQQYSPSWDTTPSLGSVANLQITETGAYQTHRVYSVGAGQDKGTLIRVVENLEPTSRGFPLLEKYIKQGDSENPETVISWGKADLEANTNTLQEISMNIRADGIYRLGQFWPGDEVELILKDWLALSDGSHKVRLLQMSGDLTQDVRISLQTER